MCGESGARERERVCVCGPIHKYHVLFHQVVVVRDENILYFGKVLINTSKAQSIRSKVDLFCGKTVYKNIFCLLVMILQQKKKGVEFKQVKIDSFLIKAMTTVNIYSLQEPRKGNIK